MFSDCWQVNLIALFYFIMICMINLAYHICSEFKYIFGQEWINLTGTLQYFNLLGLSLKVTYCNLRLPLLFYMSDYQ